ncbi:MAG: hypothetical protein K9M45_14240 [Kiritimatiellales bacterium]|nr:hypothetical protein [Kiritimatiellales bacterium]
MSKNSDECRSQSGQVELKFLEKVAGRLPDDMDVLFALADLYTKAGKFKEGLEVDLELSQRNPKDHMVWYNLGCSFALTDRKDEAFEALTKAVELGYADYDWMKQDGDLFSLRDDPRFETLLSWLYTACDEEY